MSITLSGIIVPHILLFISYVPGAGISPAASGKKAVGKTTPHMTSEVPWSFSLV
jgi:hypothetical protein